MPTVGSTTYLRTIGRQQETQRAEGASQVHSPPRNGATAAIDSRSYLAADAASKDGGRTSYLNLSAILSIALKTTYAQLPACRGLLQASAR